MNTSGLAFAHRRPESTDTQRVRSSARQNACTGRRDVQGGADGSRSSLLRMFTDGNRSFSFQTPLQMQRFLGAALAFCKLYPNNVAYVLRCLGSQDTAGLQRLREISSFPHTVTAGTSRTLCSFQRVTCAMLHLITLPLLANSLLTQCYNPMLAIVADNLDLTAVCNSAEALSVRGSIADPNFRPIDQGQDIDMWQPETWVQLLQPIVNFVNQVVQRFGCNTQEQLLQMQQHVAKLQQAVENFRKLDRCSGDNSIVNNLCNLERLLASKEAEQQDCMGREAAQVRSNLHFFGQKKGSRRQQANQDGPGNMRSGGPRHDNDHASITDISIAPTQQEVLSSVLPYLPSNQPGTVMHLESGSQEAHKDLHFRLLRHDMVAELIESATRFHKAGGTAAALAKGATSGRANLAGDNDNMCLYVYSNIEVQNLVISKVGAGIHYEVAFDDLPINHGRSTNQRREYWERSRRLQQGTLVALWWENPADQDTQPQTAADPCIEFATISMRNEQLLAPREEDLRPRIHIRLCQGCEANDSILMAALGAKLPGKAVMLQASGSFFAYEPILKALQSNQNMPLADFIASPNPFSEPAQRPDAEGPAGTSLLKGLFHQGSKLFGKDPEASTSASSTTAHVGAPDYQTEEGCLLLDLSCLTQHADLPQEVADTVKNININRGSWADGALQQTTTLDRSQLLALQAALSRKLGLIQGPPGTGKTYVGIQLVKALIHNTQGNAKPMPDRRGLDPGPHLPEDTIKAVGPKVGPVLIVTFTNHALDQFLEGLLAAGLTDMVRVGGRSKSGSLAEYNIHELVTGKASQAQKQLLHESYARAGSLEQRLAYLKASLMKEELAWSDVHDHIEVTAPDLCDSLMSRRAPMDDEFQEVTNRKHFWWQWVHDSRRNKAQESAAAAAIARATTAQPDSQNRFAVLDQDVAIQELADDLQGWGFTTTAPIPPVAPEPLPGTAADRNLDDLLCAQDAWTMTRSEREKLYKHWEEELRSSWLSELKMAMREYEGIKDEQRRIHADVDLNVVKSARLVGMTTAGVASKQELVAAMAPKIVIVEEAGEVFEAHILASLAPTTEHLILIGDHEQLRPKPQLYALQTESGQGYDLDRSLFERLVRQGFPVATLKQQRRMRPSISRLIRNTIYPSLQDHAAVAEYPNVRGMMHNVFFWDHNHPEGGKDENSSKQNLVEAARAARLALYLTQQGYKAGDITILTPYVGQLMQLRAEVSKFMRFVVSDKDAEQLAACEGDEASTESAGTSPSSTLQSATKPKASAAIAQVSLKDSVRVATVDNFQGEESTIVILSLVRNNKDGQIGFLKTSNRINVMLSRAKHGMYILGHADTLTANKKSTMWRKVLDMLEQDDAVRQALPVVCANHPDHVSKITDAKHFDTFVRDGGCSRQCQARMPCGHTCPRLCHPDDVRHLATQCPKPCTHQLQPCGHPCTKLCYQDCGFCTRLIPDLPLACGHTAHDVPCYKAQQSDTVQCNETITVHMPEGFCGHELQVKCGEAAAVEADEKRCTAVCGHRLECGHTCQHKCGDCAAHRLKPMRKGLPSEEKKSGHLPCSHKCTRELLCGHSCGNACHGGSTCPPCSRPCAAQCVHGRCMAACTDPCAPCAEPCTWHCPHQGPCHLPCGAPCSRLPCDLRCTRRLTCGHQCPSVCGEPCPKKKFCVKCGVKTVTAYDIIMDENRSVRDYKEEEVTEDPLFVLACGHVLPMSSMDGFMELHKAYTQDRQGKWHKPYQIKEGEQQPVKSCPICRQPLTQLMRYGRPLNHMKVQHADMKFFLFCNQQLSHADELYQVANKAASDSANTTGAPAPAQAGNRQPPRIHQDRMILGFRHAIYLAQQAVIAYQAVQSFRPPTVAVYEATRCNIWRLEAQLKAQGYSTAATAAACDSLQVPRPDVGTYCKAMVGHCYALSVYMAACTGVMQRLMQLSDQFPGQALPPEPADEVRQMWQNATWGYGTAIRTAEAAQALAQQNHSTQTVVKAKIATLRVQQQRIRDLDSIQGASVQAMLGSTAANRSAKEQQRKLFQTAEKASRQLHRELSLPQPSPSAAAQGATTAIHKELDALSENFAVLRKLVDNQEVTQEERQSIVEGLMLGNADLAGGGYTGQGHFYKCANGHPYVIGDCGGATEQAHCPECGATIGGSQHQLTAGNTQAVDLQNLADQVEARRNWH